MFIASQSSGGSRRHYTLYAFCQIIIYAGIITVHFTL